MAFILSTLSHNLVVDEDTGMAILSEDGKMVLLNKIEDNILQYCPIEDVQKVFGTLHVHPVQSTVPSRASTSTASDTDTSATSESTSKDNDRSRIAWTHSNILKLIDIYKEHSSLFKSQTIRHEKIWKMMSDKLPGFTTEQVKNKFKYLKARYIKKIENMSDKASGDDKFIFEYFDQFNDLFGKDPNVKPISIASSMKKRKLSDNEHQHVAPGTETEVVVLPAENVTTENLQPLKPKEKKLGNHVEKMTEVLTQLRQDLNNREEERKRRHVENLRQKEESTAAFKEYLQFLKEK